MATRKNNRDWLSLSEAASLVGVSRQRLHQIVGEMQLKTTPINPRFSVISRAEVKKIIAKRKSNASA